MVKRIAAVAAAVAMVVIAVIVRGGSGDSASTDSASPDGVTALVCAADLAASCTASGSTFRVEQASDTAARLLAATSAADLDAGAWITTSAWADLVVAERARLGLPALFAVDGTAVATSPVVTVIWQDRQTQLATRCEVVDWRCLADNAGATLAEGDRVQTGLPRVGTAVGLVVAAQQAGSLLGSAGFAANDFDATFLADARTLAAGQRRDPLTTLRSRGPGEFTAVATVAALASELSSNFGTLQQLAIDPRTVAEVVALVPAGATFGAGDRDRLGAALVDAGFDAPAAGLEAALPSGGVLAAIHTLWSDNG